MLPWFQNNAVPLYLAPMAGFTDTVYRQLCKREGADVLVSEFVLADTLVSGRPEAWEEVSFSPDQRPFGTQIFGSCPDTMAAAANLLAERRNPDFVDLNFGCPSEKVTCKNAGSSLLRDPARLAEVAGTVARRLAGTGIPVTAKIRIGWDDRSIVAHEVARRLEDAGIQAVAIHGRTKEQGYRGDANWEVIESVARSVSIPVIGNGNIRSAEDVARIMTSTPIRGIMIGRAALGYPWIFREIKETLRTGQAPPPPTLEQRWETILTYARLLLARPQRDRQNGDIRWMRPRLIKLTKDMTGCKRVRGGLQRVTSIAQLETLAAEHLTHYREADEAVRLGIPRIHALA